MSAVPEFVLYIYGQLASLGQLTIHPFFGGHAFKIHGTQFAMAMRNTLYFCVDDSTRSLYIGAGSLPFVYNTARGPREVRKYYCVPPELYEDASQLMEWARRAVIASRQG